MQVMLAGNYWTGKEEALSSQLDTDHRIVRWAISDGLAAFGALIRETDVLVVSPDVALDATALPLLRDSRTLQLVHLPFAGYDWLPQALLPDGCRVCNVHEHSSAIAEYVLASLLEMEIGLREIDRTFRAGSWEYGGGTSMGRKHGELRGKRLGIFGYGHIGQEVAVRAKAFGMTCCAVGSRARTQVPPLLDWLGGPESFDRLLAESDYLLIAAPLNDATRGRFDARALAAMKEGSVLVNVGRGPIVDPAALFEALQQGRPRAAVLDVWYRYPSPQEPHPRPADQPFETLPNVLMTPHCSSWTTAQDARRIAFIASNIARLARGDELLNTVMFQPPAPVVPRGR